MEGGREGGCREWVVEDDLVEGGRWEWGVEEELMEWESVLVGVGGNDDGPVEAVVRSVILLAFEELEDMLLVLLVGILFGSWSGRAPNGVSVGETGGERCEIAIMALVASEYFL